ncbi:uncharacterized protein AMSG_11893 [Thecamonas trahens ATCC 50062]|uniref:Uncharacterized protein n=1 Tax=Thecamonas trahens ATCC 50062 TaxID=461836 RepID=A0A0L0DBY7_THETB|nr:hypothetical protein AMSG_11893 [Thecamonas trahens ATCC 50062]KNC49581.1 hypothetical protein AMSG_11893 [Thecamonas trahens ATCC 50062]|eukprot:XP_013757767.1 hypothetical protein AMSG_11893 [Thecamonas trahens ATCC 50062]
MTRKKASHKTRSKGSSRKGRSSNRRGSRQRDDRRSHSSSSSQLDADEYSASPSRKGRSKGKASRKDRGKGKASRKDRGKGKASRKDRGKGKASRKGRSKGKTSRKGRSNSHRRGQSRSDEYSASPSRKSKSSRKGKPKGEGKGKGKTNSKLWSTHSSESSSRPSKRRKSRAAASSSDYDGTDSATATRYTVDSCDSDAGPTSLESYSSGSSYSTQWACFRKRRGLHSTSDGKGSTKAACSGWCAEWGKWSRLPCVTCLLVFGRFALAAVLFVAAYYSGNPVIPLVLGMVYFLLCDPFVAVLSVMGLTKINILVDDFDDREWEIVTWATIAAIIAACFFTSAAGVFVAELGSLDNMDNHWIGPVPATRSAQLAALSAKRFFEFTDYEMPIAVTGYHISHSFKKTGLITPEELPVMVTPVTSPNGTEVNVWACACAKPRSYGCRRFPAVDVTSGDRQAAWRKPHIRGGVRVKSRAIVDFCQRAANEAIGKDEFKARYTVGVEARQAVFVEWAAFDPYRTELTVIISTIITVTPVCVAVSESPTAMTEVHVDNAAPWSTELTRELSRWRASVDEEDEAAGRMLHAVEYAAYALYATQRWRGVTAVARALTEASVAAMSPTVQREIEDALGCKVGDRGELWMLLATDVLTDKVFSMVVILDDVAVSGGTLAWLATYARVPTTHGLVGVVMAPTGFFNTFEITAGLPNV